MSRADEVRARYEDELAVAELEDEVIRAKVDGALTRDLKLQLRETRREFRLRREGSAAAQAETVQTTSTAASAAGGED